MRALLVSCALAVACGEERGPPRPPPPRADEPRAALADELEPPPPAAWPTRIDSLADTLASFTTVEACQSELRERTTTSVAEGIADLGYDGFFEDTCRALDAVRQGSIEQCDELGVSTARAGCRTRLALVHGRPAACPAGRVLDGPEPLCVAWARRDPDLCRAVAAPDDVRCRAVLAGDEASCEPLRPGDRQRCEAQVRRYAPSMPGARRESPAARASAIFRLAVDAPEASRTIERAVLDRGVRATAAGCRHEIALASVHGEPVLPAVGTFEPTFHVRLAIPPGDPPLELPLGALDAVLWLALPERGGITSIAGASGSVRVERFEREVGGGLEGTIEGTLTHGEVEIPVRGRFATFLRDLEPLPSHCAGREPAER